MQKIYLEKAIDLQHQLKELIALSVDESINYKIENEGIRAIGNLIIKGEYKNIEKQIFEETLELDVLATFDKILDQRDFSIKVEDFDYTIKEGNITVSIEAGVHGVISGEDRYVKDDPVHEIETLIRESEKDMMAKEELSNRKSKVAKSTKTSEVEAITEKVDSTLVAHQDLSEKLDSTMQERPTIKKAEVKKAEVKKTEVKKTEVKEAEKIEVEKIETLITKKETKPVVEKREHPVDEKIKEVAKEIDEQLQEVVYQSKSRPIFQDTGDSVGTYYLYIIKTDDTYQSIAEHYGVNENVIKEYNQNRELEIGSVLIIPYVP